MAAKKAALKRSELSPLLHPHPHPLSPPPPHLTLGFFICQSHRLNGDVE